MPKRCKAVNCPPCALAKAREMLSKSRPDPALTSSPSLSNPCALVTSPVARTKVSNAGRSCVSDTPVENCKVVINFSLAAICAFVAPVTFCKVLASLSCAF